MNEASLPAGLGRALDSARLQRFRAMFDAHHALVYRVARRCGLDADASEDAAQQVFLVAMRRLDEIEQDKERAFLCATAVRVAARIRQQHARPPAAPEGTWRGPDSTRTDELVDQKRRRELLDRILSEMDEDLRVVLVLAEIEELGKREIAEALEIPEGTAASRLRRAREDFQVRLKRHLAAGGVR